MLFTVKVGHMKDKNQLQYLTMDQSSKYDLVLPAFMSKHKWAMMKVEVELKVKWEAEFQWIFTNYGKKVPEIHWSISGLH